MARADLKHCEKIPDVGEELKKSIREGRMESRLSVMSLEDSGLRSHDLKAELRLHLMRLGCDTLLDEEKVAIVVPVTSEQVKVTGSKAMFVLSLSICS